MERYRDADRPVLLAEIEVVNRNCTELLLPQVRNSGVLSVSHAGQKERFLVYEDDVPSVMAQVETEPELILAARKVWERKTRTMLAEKELIPKDLEWSKIDFNQPDIKSAMTGWSLSEEAVFQDQNDRPIKPLISCEVIRAGIMQTPQDDPLARFKTAPLTQQITPELLAQAVALVRQMEKQAAQQAQQPNQPNRR